jgi:hypothetical protein
MYVKTTREALEGAGFPVHETPIDVDPFHVTIEIPKPVTEGVANQFNALWSEPKPNPNPRKTG